VINGYTPCDKGNIYFRKKDIAHSTPQVICRSGIGRSFQVVNIFPKLTVFQNIQMGIISHMKANRAWFIACKDLYKEEVRRILNEMGLTDNEETISSSLSQGDQKMLDIGIALTSFPKLLLLDEPTAGLNPQESMNIIGSLKRICTDRQMAVLFIEHDMSVVMTSALRVLVMHQGRMIADGTPDEVRKSELVKQVYLGE
jgi:branched-chain amino acid transport system ATP-binding protein